MDSSGEPRGRTGQTIGAGGEAGHSDVAIALACLLVLVLAWGGNYTWVKIAVRDIGPLYFNVIRYGLGAALLIVVLMAMGRSRDILPEPSERIGLAIIGLLQAFVMTTFTAIALQWIEAGRVVLIAYSMPIWALIWSRLLIAELITWRSLFGTILGFLGLVVLTDPMNMRWEGGVLPGIILSVLAVNGWALGSVIYRRRKWKSSFWSQVFWQVAATAVAATLLAPVFEDFSAIRWTTPMLTATVYNAVVPIVLGFFLWMQALSRISASAASQVLVISPIFGMVQSHYVLGEPLGASIWISSALIAGGAWLALSGQSKQRQSGKS